MSSVTVCFNLSAPLVLSKPYPPSCMHADNIVCAVEIKCWVHSSSVYAHSLLCMPMIYIQAAKSVPLQFLPHILILIWVRKSVHPHLQYSRQDKVYPSTLSCLVYNIILIGRVHHTICAHASKIVSVTCLVHLHLSTACTDVCLLKWAGKCVPLYSLLPEYSRWALFCLL